MDIYKLEYFMAVARYEHMTKAANEMYITQPSLSRIISQLESELNYKLFDREGRAIKLNENGRIVYDAFSRILMELQDMQDHLSDLSDGTNGHIVFASSFPTRDPDWITDVIRTYILSHTKVAFYQLRKSVSELRQCLEDRSIDIALSDRPLVGSNIEWVELYSERLGVILAKDNPLTEKDELELRDLEDIPFYCNNDSSAAQDITSYICEASGFNPNIMFRGDFPSLLGQLISKTNGVAFMSEGAFLNGFANKETTAWHPDITFRFVSDRFCRRVFGVAVIKNRYLPKVVRDFFNMICNYDISAYRSKL